ncbi:catalase-related domain-containing protein [Phycicoccus sp. HDW14]|uniref:catalase-related domain-containing protein n=1 Tax=Phycicoccus sp. HDW14 TaxID=2714941 RepID=UPI001F106AD3|nr:catalase-related domain-containing protein [Phycicoccus sp. HDW14]
MLVRDVFDDAQRDRFVETVAGALGGVRDDVLERAFVYWGNVDVEIGRRIEERVRGGAGDPIPGAADEEKSALREPLPESAHH